MKASLLAATAALIIGAACGLASAPACAHHSFAIYDMSRTPVIEGTVKSFEWSNPHSWLFVEAPGPDGAVATYGFEMTSVGELLRRGWTKTAVRPGDKIKVSFHPVRDGSPAGQLQNAWTSNGKLIGRSMGGDGSANAGGGGPAVTTPGAGNAAPGTPSAPGTNTPGN